MCHFDLTTNAFSFKMDISTEMSTDSPTPCTAMVVTPRVGGGQNSETYWVCSSNIFPIT